MRTLLILTTALILNSCSSMKDTIDAKGSGTKTTFNKSFDIVWDGLIDIIAVSELSLKSEKKKDGVILANTEMSILSYGQHVAIFVKKISKSKTEVEVVSKSKVSTDIFTTNWEKYFIKEMNSKFN